MSERGRAPRLQRTAFAVPAPGDGDECLAAVVVGNCMVPAILDGDLVLFKTVGEPEIGQVCVVQYQRDGKTKFMIKRYVGRVGDRYIVSPDNGRLARQGPLRAFPWLDFAVATTRLYPALAVQRPLRIVPVGMVPVGRFREAAAPAPSAAGEVTREAGIEDGAGRTVALRSDDEV